MKVWFDSLPRVSQFIVAIALVVIANLLVVGIVCAALGLTDRINASNALFYDAAVVLLIALVFYFATGRRRPSWRTLLSSDLAKQRAAELEPEEDEEARQHRRRLSLYSTTLILAGFVLFGLSIAVGSL